MKVPIIEIYFLNNTIKFIPEKIGIFIMRMFLQK